MTANTVAWFEVATRDPEAAQEFYGELFGWTFAADPDAASVGMDYRVITYPGADQPVGGIFGTGGSLPDRAVFSVAVTDVSDACARGEKLGGTVVYAETKPQTGPAFAYLKDRSGNLVPPARRPSSVPAGPDPARDRANRERARPVGC